MRDANVKYVKGAHKNYPQWHEITSELTEKFQEEFHPDLRNKGYEIKACNIAAKDKDLFWILLRFDGWYELEHYATLLD